jgi:hypothetical protein
VGALSKKFGLTTAPLVRNQVVHQRMRKGMSFVEAATTPPMRYPGTGAKALCKKFGITPVVDPVTIDKRMRKGMSFAEAAMTPATKPLVSSDLKARNRSIRNRALRAELHRPFKARSKAMGLTGVSAAEWIRALRTMGAISPTSLASQARKHGLSSGAVHWRIKSGWSLERALTTPTQPQSRDPLFAKQARAHGLNPGTVRARIKSGWSLKQALTTPLHPPKKRDPNTISEKARAHGLKPAVVRERIRKYGWSLERALAVPMLDPANSISNRARAHGLKPATVIMRIHQGWSVERALTTPLPDLSNSISKQARAHGLKPGTVLQRMKTQGMTLEEALTTELRPRKPNTIAEQARAQPAP